MKVIDITVGIGRGFNDPWEAFSNYKPSLSLRAVLEEGEDEVGAVKRLQETAHKLIEEERARILAAREAEVRVPGV